MNDVDSNTNSMTSGDIPTFARMKETPLRCDVVHTRKEFQRPWDRRLARSYERRDDGKKSTNMAQWQIGIRNR